MKKYFRAGQATDDHKAHAHCMLDISGYKSTVGICKTFIFHCNNGCTKTLDCGERSACYLGRSTAKEDPFSLNRWMDGPWSQYGRFREEKSFASRLFLVRN